MKKLIIIFATLGLMFQITGCTGKKTQDEAEVVENADVERIEAEDALFAGDSTTQEGAVDDSLQAALGEAPQVDDVATAPSTETDLVYTDNAGTDMAATPAPEITEESLSAGFDANASVAQNSVDSGIEETPVVETPVDTSFDAPTTDVAQNETNNLETDLDLTPDTSAAGTVADSSTTSTDAITETPVIETPVGSSTDSYASSYETSSTSTYEDPVAPKASVAATPKKPATAANSKSLQKIANTTPYAHGDGYVNAVYIVRPKEKLIDISQAIYGADKTAELKSINSFVKSRQPRAGEKIYYISPNRPSDSTRMLSFYEDTGMVPSTYVAQKGDTLPKVAKQLLGYDNAWKEMWTTNAVDSKARLTAGETLYYWKPVGAPPAPTLAHNDGNAKLVDSAPAMTAPVETTTPAQDMAANSLPPPPPPQDMAQELPPPPPMPEPQMDQSQDIAAAPAQDFNAPPTDMGAPQEIPPPPPPQEVAAAPVQPPPAAAHNMEEEVAGEGMGSDTTMMMGVVVILVALLALVLVRRNKKKKEAEMSSIEHTHVGT